MISISRLCFLYNQFIRFVSEKKYRYRLKERGTMKVNIISPGEDQGWIIYKFGKSVYDELKKMGIEVYLNDHYNSNADINHYFMPNNIGYSGYSKVDSRTTFMITHVDTLLKLNQIKECTAKGAIGICMSLETRNTLIASGVPRDKICYIHPAQDGVIQPRKIALGFTYKVHDDNRKRDDMLIDICKEIDARMFKFVIMGEGWTDIVKEVRSLGFEVNYYDTFDKEQYNKLMPRLDYYCYFGFDEGSMGYLDAVAAGIGTIVTPQGYHLDTKYPITHPVRTLEDILAVLHNIEAAKRPCFDFISNWTWENYAKKHIEIWQYMLCIKPLSELLKNRGCYEDGIFSLLLRDLENDSSLLEKVKKV